MSNGNLKKKLFLTICMIVGIVSVAGSNQTYIRKTPTNYISIEQSLDSLSKILDYVKLQESINPSFSDSPTE